MKIFKPYSLLTRYMTKEEGLLILANCEAFSRVVAIKKDATNILPTDIILLDDMGMDGK